MQNYNIQEIANEIRNSAKHEKKIFSIIGSTKTTYKKLLEDIDKIHALFQAKGLEKGHILVLSTKDEYLTSMLFLAGLEYGITTIFIDPNVPSIRAEAIIASAEATSFIMDKDLFAERQVILDETTFALSITKPAKKKGKLFKKLLKKSTTDIVDKFDFHQTLANTNEQPKQLTPLTADDRAYILYTSGTTSAPKGVVINHGNLQHHLSTLSRVYELTEDANILNILMLYHADGCIQGPLLSFINKASWFRPFDFDIAKVDDLFSSIYKYQISHFITVPTMSSLLLKFSEGYEDSFETPDFKYMISVASKLETQLWEALETTFKTTVFNVYGLTETVAGSFFSSIGNSRKIGSIGKPEDCQAKIVNDLGEVTAQGKSGVLHLKGGHIFTEYFKNSSATDAVLINGWFNTGDVAIEDNEGFYTIVGREKSTINSGGINIYPEQITEVLNVHPKIFESCCLGLEDNNFGERLVAAIVLKEGEELDQLTLINDIRQQLENNQIPKEFYFVEKLPKGLSGKVQINQLKTEILANASTVNTQQNTKDLQATIFKVASEAFGIKVEDIKPTDNSNTLDGWDSMRHLFFVTQLEEQFNIQFNTAEMMTMNSIANTERIINKKLA